MNNALSVVVPAAGLSRRMGETNKLLQPVGAFATLLDATLSAIEASDATMIVVVTGHQHETVEEAASRHEVAIIHNPHFELGMGASIKAGVAFVPSDHAVMIWPADMPFIRPETVSELRKLLTRESVTRPVYLDRPGHPVLFGAAYRSDLLNIPDDSGARQVLQRNAASVTLLQVDDPGVVRDLDTSEDFDRHS